MTLTSALSVGSCTNVILAESFLLYFAVLILLEPVPVLGAELGAGWNTWGNPAFFLCLFWEGLLCFFLWSGLNFAAVISLLIGICCNISSIKPLAVKYVIGKESAVIDTKIGSEKVEPAFWAADEWGAAGHLQSYFAGAVCSLWRLALQTGQRYFFSDKVVIPILIWFLLALCLNSKPEQ